MISTLIPDLDHANVGMCGEEAPVFRERSEMKSGRNACFFYLIGNCFL